MTEPERSPRGTWPEIQNWVARHWVKLGIAALALYELLVISLLGRELYESSLRGTDRVLILLALLFLPLLLVVVGRILGVVVSRANLILKLGDFEIDIRNLQKKVDDQAEITQEMTGKLSTAEQTLYPMIGGPNAFARSRLEQGRVVIGSKDFAANIVVAELLAQHLEAAGVRCERRIPNGGTVTNYAYLINGWIDLFVDYTGTGCLFLNIEFRDRSDDDVLRDLDRLSQERFKVEWLRPLGTATNYCLVMRKDVAQRKNIRRISDLALRDRGKLRFCGNHEFLNRRDGLPGLRDFYGLRFENETVCSYAERYRLVHEKKVDVSVGHTTDPEIGNLDLKLLDDDKRFFPNYYEVPIARTEALEVVPGLRDALLAFAHIGINNEDITSLIQDFRDKTSSLHEEVNALLARKQAQSAGA